jgi:flagellar hook assembly protein FlgD
LNEGAFSVLWRSAPRPASLAQNVPNPFNPTTSIAFTVPEAQHVRLSVYTLDGRLVRVLTDGIVEAGAHRVEWDGRDHLGRESASGTYVYQMTAGGEELVHRMLLVR